MSVYRYFVSDTLPNPSTGRREIRGTVPLTSVRRSEGWNRQGELPAAIDLRSPKATREMLDPGRTSIFVEKNGQIVWGGILWSVEPVFDYQCRIQCYGYHSWVAGPSPNFGRFLRHPKTYDGVGQCDIVRDLWNYVQDEELHGPGANIGVTVPTGDPGIARERTDWQEWEYHNIGDLIVSLSEVIDGINFRFQHRWEGDGLDRHIVTELIVTEGLPRRNIGAVFKTGKNIIDGRHSIDATRMARRIYELGSGQGVAMVRTERSALVPGYPLIEMLDREHSSVTDAMTLEQHGDEMLRRRQLPLTLPSIVVTPGPDPEEGSYLPGEEVRVITTLPGTPAGSIAALDAWVRLGAVTVDIGETDVDIHGEQHNADEHVTLDLLAA